jgi:hypothetical protein
MGQLTWEDFSNSALTTNGLLADLLSNPDDPNSVLGDYGLSPLSSSDVDRWQQVLASTDATPTQREVLEYIAQLLPGGAGDKPATNTAPPMW